MYFNRKRWWPPQECCQKESCRSTRRRASFSNFGPTFPAGASICLFVVGCRQRRSMHGVAALHCVHGANLSSLDHRYETIQQHQLNSCRGVYGRVTRRQEFHTAKPSLLRKGTTRPWVHSLCWTSSAGTTNSTRTAYGKRYWSRRDAQRGRVFGRQLSLRLQLARSSDGGTTVQEICLQMNCQENAGRRKSRVEPPASVNCGTMDCRSNPFSVWPKLPWMRNAEAALNFCCATFSDYRATD